MKLTKQGISNFVSAVGRVASATMNQDPVLVDSSVKRKRLDICKICEHNVSNQCNICECLVIAKAILATENCPKGKW